MRNSLLTSLLVLASNTALAAYTEAPVANGGTITGKVAWDGPVPAATKVTVKQDPGTCGTTRELQEVEVSKEGGVANVVVYLVDIASGKKLELPPRPVLDQKGCHYTPGVQVIAVNSELQVKNSDPILHNVHAYSGQGGSTVLNLAMPKQDMVIGKKMKKLGGVTLKCDVHDFMRGAFFVAENPYFAITKEDGSYSIADVPPGTYAVATFHEVAQPKQGSVTVPAGGTATFSPKIK
jgi:hypothetical protein